MEPDFNELWSAADSIAANVINGNLSDARAELTARGELRAAYLALRVRDLLEPRGEADRWHRLLVAWLP